ncbi:MAG: hypothetical protein HOG66_09635 [Flavobacteriales bacterium]|nr:hypothetical protein [Flavobacteriales bacterium]MBT6133369.1 hypothetical protein [Flavobacteriales bacterium]NCG29818.1 hypothetical protein [Bacteroidota bacterium]
MKICIEGIQECHTERQYIIWNCWNPQERLIAFQPKRKLMMKYLLMSTVVALISCQDECANVVCENDGVCISGDCECPAYYDGDRCEIYNPEGVKGEETGETGEHQCDNEGK